MQKALNRQCMFCPVPPGFHSSSLWQWEQGDPAPPREAWPFPGESAQARKCSGEEWVCISSAAAEREDELRAMARKIRMKERERREKEREEWERQYSRQSRSPSPRYSREYSSSRRRSRSRSRSPHYRH
ncbi:hypothetical protein H8959_005581 [Pygathrix nigripes]